MAVCVTINQDGTITATGEPVEQCTGYVMLSGSEYAGVQQLNAIFQWPEPDVLASWFSAAFILIVMLNAAGSITGSVVKMLSTDRH